MTLLPFLRFPARPNPDVMVGLIVADHVQQNGLDYSIMPKGYVYPVIIVTILPYAKF